MARPFQMKSWRRPLSEWNSALWITKTTETSRLSPAVIWPCRQDRLLRMGLRSSWSPLCLFSLPIHNSRSTPTTATPVTSTSSASTVTTTSAPRPRTHWAAPAARARWTCPMMRAVHGGARSSPAPSDTSSTRGIDWVGPRCRSSRKSTTFWSAPPAGNASFTTSQCKWWRNCRKLVTSWRDLKRNWNYSFTCYDDQFNNSDTVGWLWPQIWYH